MIVAIAEFGCFLVQLLHHFESFKETFSLSGNVLSSPLLTLNNIIGYSYQTFVKYVIFIFFKEILVANSIKLSDNMRNH